MDGWAANVQDALAGFLAGQKRKHQAPPVAAGELMKRRTAKMQAALERAGLWQEGMTFSTARQFMQGICERRKKNLCTFKQARLLARYGLPTNRPFETASAWIDRIAKNGWRCPPSLYQEASRTQ